ncbi:MAG: hypothetical protein ACYDCK_10000 [Thermoplasmatota archaeon]
MDGANYRASRSHPMTPLWVTRPGKAVFDALIQEGDLVARRRLVQPEFALMLLTFAARRVEDFFEEVASLR